MRTTLNLDEEVFEELKRYAENRSVAMGKAASDLLRKGLDAPLQTQVVNGFHVIVLPKGTPKITSARVKELLEDEI